MWKLRSTFVEYVLILSSLRRVGSLSSRFTKTASDESNEGPVAHRLVNLSSRCLYGKGLGQLDEEPWRWEQRSRTSGTACHETYFEGKPCSIESRTCGNQGIGPKAKSVSGSCGGARRHLFGHRQVQPTTSGSQTAACGKGGGKGNARGRSSPWCHDRGEARRNLAAPHATHMGGELPQCTVWRNRSSSGRSNSPTPRTHSVVPTANYCSKNPSGTRQLVDRRSNACGKKLA